MREPWGKLDLPTGDSHHLIHHSADVAAVVHELLHLPGFRSRLDAAAGARVSDDGIACLAALAFLHDVGKLAPAFQAKGWPAGHGITPRDHLRCGWRWLKQEEPGDCLDGNALHLIRWPGLLEWFKVLFAHHGAPIAEPPETWATAAFNDPSDYNWKASERQMGRAMLAWFPQIATAAPPQPVPRLAHHFAGVLALADWIGSDRSVFGFVPDHDPHYYTKARGLARARLREIQLDTAPATLRGRADWSLLSDHPQPRAAQQKLAEIPLDETLVILEAETGSGKTEAALWRFAMLYQLICELYFGDSWARPPLAEPGPDEGADDLLLIAEAFARGNSKTDGFKSRVIPVPKAVKKTMLGSEAVELARDQIELITKVDIALRNGLALISAEGERDKVGKANYARTAPARDALQARADALFFPALWDKLAAGSETGRLAVHARLMRDMAAAARAAFERAAPAIPCASIMRPRAETRGRAALNRGIAAIFKESDMTEVEHA